MCSDEYDDMPGDLFAQAIRGFPSEGYSYLGAFFDILEMIFFGTSDESLNDGAAVLPASAPAPVLFNAGPVIIPQDPQPQIAMASSLD